MQVPRHWRLRHQRYALIGEVCPNCHNPIFPPRPVCPYCQSEVSQYALEQSADLSLNITRKVETPLPVSRGD